MSLIKQHLHKLENPDYYPIDIDDRYQVELSLSLDDVELLLNVLEEQDYPSLASEIRDQTYA